MTTSPPQTWQILSPIGKPAGLSSAETVPAVAGLGPEDVVTICRNGWPSWARITEQLVERLRDRRLQVRFVDVPLGRAMPSDQMERIATESNLVILGLANCGSCTVATMQNYQALGGQSQVVIAVTERFVDLASSLASGAPIETLPHDIEQSSDEVLDSWALKLESSLPLSSSTEVRRAG